jgi:Raf kinase inhibitor-like YbhB/YbcL family protein
MILALAAAFALTSPDLRDGGTVPSAFVWNRDGCTGANRTPRLHWTAPPPGTASLRLVVDDHDAPKPGGWIHWHVEGIPPSARGLGPALPRGARPERNDWGTIGWGGPCPPPGAPHHYTFALDALDAHGHVLATARMVPVYGR